jgi:predicted nucleic acid-binding protein
MGYVIIGHAEGHYRHQRCGLGLSQPLRGELRPVLKRPEQLAASGLSLSDVDSALDALAALIEPVEAHLSWRPQLDDPDDEMVLEAAVNGRADALVTYNAAHFRAAAARFGVRVASPIEVLREAIEP